MSIASILIANRGEIACRIMRTARDMGIRTIAVFSEPDTEAPHVTMADDSVCIGPGPVAQSYLSIEGIISAAHATGAEAIHPGYGFLSENADFAKAVADAGLMFIGPPASAIAAMGNKAEAKRLMLEAGVPCVPGYQGRDQSDEALEKAAAEIGFPVMIKAAAGGGGRGMRVVTDESDLANAITRARSEAESAFGSGELILEKAVTNARHVEVQVFADMHGNCIHLGERDCSVQRRHQKIIEEAPSPAVDANLREKMGAAAVEAAKAVDYVGAGTVEFLLDAKGPFYFLEMNTRLQVEHPVTEMITGFDLVEWQINVANGEPLPVKQDEVEFNGHAIEVRLYAEDPATGFMPSAGRLHLWDTPFDMHIRVDGGVESGQEISSFYDPLLAKIIAHEDSREDARRRLSRALGRTAAFGPATNRDFLIQVLDNEVIANGEATTSFLESEMKIPQVAGDLSDNEIGAIAASLAFYWECNDAFGKAWCVSEALSHWSSSKRLDWPFAFRMSDEKRSAKVRANATGCTVTIEGENHRIECVYQEDFRVQIRLNHRDMEISYLIEKNDIFVATDRQTYHLKHGLGLYETGSSSAAAGQLTAPMHGRIIDLAVSEGDEVSVGSKLGVLEAMKMQHQLVSEVVGQVTSIHVTVGDQVAAGQLILEIEPRDQQ